MKQLALLLLLIKRAATACAEGCLRCSPSDTCLICENWANYYLSEGACQQRALKDCQLISQSGACLQCAPAFFYDLNAKACAPVPADFAIPHCESYGSDLACRLCAPGHFFSEGKCLPAPTEIASCLYYRSTGGCQVCAPGLLASINGESCLSPKGGDPNCASFSLVKCRNCLATHIFNPNFYLIKAMGNSEEAADRVLEAFLKNAEAGATPVCAPKQIAHCERYLDFYTCAQCAAGHFLEAPDRCAANPRPEIVGCEAYASESVCSHCRQGFFLKSPAECAAVAPVARCLEYSANATSTKCELCEPAYFLSPLLACELRKMSLSLGNCTAVARDRDACEVCVEGELPTEDGLRCLSAPANCREVAPSSAGSLELVCLYCKPNFYLDPATKKCKLGSVTNCLEYEQYANTCARCQNKFYLAAGACSLHSDISNCEIYSPKIRNQCDRCKPTALLFSRANVCAPVTPVAGCRIYAGEATCLECEDGYKLAGATCLQIAPARNCLRVNSADLCIKCRPEFALDNNICSPPFAFLTANCLATNLALGDLPLSQAVCTACKEGAYPFSYQDHYMCVEDALIPAWTGKTFSNCRQVEFRSGDYFCRKCAAGKFMAPTGECVDACPDSHALVLYTIAAAGSEFAAAQALFCEADSLCRLKVMNNQPGNLDVGVGCAKCADSAVPVANPNTLLSIPMNKYDPLAGATVPAAPVLFLPSLACGLVASLVDLSGVTVIENCEYYYTVNNKNGCLKCKHGFFGTLADSLSDNTGFIKTCAKMTACDDSVFQPGLSKMLNSVLSCHKCVELAKIPVVFVKAGSAYNDEIALKAYQLDLALPKTPISGGASVDCLSPAATVASYDLTALPANCGVAVLNVFANTKATSDAGKASNVNRANIAAFCAACRPGAKVAGAALDNGASPAPVKHMVSACAAIPNCKASSWFNYCSQCQDDFAYGYTPATGVQFDNCVPGNGDPNCFALDVSNPLGVFCALCQRGFSKNADGVCVKRLPPKCREGRFAMKIAFPRADFHTALFLQPEGEGCNECEAGFTAAALLDARRVCTQSAYVLGNKFPTATAFIPNCKVYSVDAGNSVICGECRSDFVLKADRKSCFPTASLKNCAEAFSEAQCERCAKNYIVVKGLCQLRKILHCRAYIENRESLAQVCSECAEGYYLNLGDCAPGEIKNCRAYGPGPEKCLACLPGFQLVYTAEQRPYCYRLDPGQNCARLATSNFDQGVAECLQCASNLFFAGPPREGDIKTACLAFQEIENCEEYGTAQFVGASTMKCRRCAPEFFAKQGVCQKRAKVIANCLQLDPANELCQKCSNRTFASGDSAQCLDFPKGIDGCVVYSDATTCAACRPDFAYNFTENRCLPVEAARRVENCADYSPYSKCRGCGPGFALSANGTCEQVLAKGCLAAANRTACASCAPGFGIRNEDGLLNCVPIPDGRCALYGLYFPFECRECQEGFFLDSAGACKPVEKPISGCAAYDSATACRRCQAGLALIEKLSCRASPEIDEVRDRNCEDSVLDASLECATCKEGFLFRNGTCVSCEVSGCHFCNPFEKGKCVVCMAGHFMDRNGTCSVVLAGQTNKNETVAARAWKLIVGGFIGVLFLIMDM